MVAALAADHRGLQPILAGDSGAAENRGRTKTKITILKTPQTDNLARGNHVVPTEWAEQLERERDEAMQKYDNLATEHMLVVNKLCKERDDARDALSRIDEIFCDGEDTHDDWMKMGIIAKDYLKGLE